MNIIKTGPCIAPPLAEQLQNKVLTKDYINTSRFTLYKSLMAVCIDKTVPVEAVSGISKIEIITEGMLDTRFQNTVSQGKKKRTRVRDDEGNLLPEKKQISTDLRRYLGIEKKTRHVPANPLHVIKFFKGLENTILTNRVNFDLNELQLGHFSELAKELVDSLTKLLLSVEKLLKVEKKGTITAIFSAVVIYRQFKVRTTPDISTVTNPYNGLSDLESDKRFSDEVFQNGIKRNFSDKLRDKDIIIKFYSGNASSPNSLSSTSKLLEDAGAVKNDEKLKNSILSLADYFEGGKQFKYFIETLFINIGDMPKAIHSRLFHFTAPGGKARIIANVDWISQSVLSGLHYYFFDLLSNIVSDQTFNHKNGIDYIYKENCKYYSIDLSAATDRVPRLLESKLIKNLMDGKGLNGNDISNHWLNIVTREFDTSNSKMNNSNPVSYSVGQGMGLFTSGTSMALLHHFIVNELCGIKTTDYALVGDDLIIRDNDEGYLKYLDIMKDIGVEVNRAKTIESSSSLEFARNYVIMNIKIVPLQFGSLFAFIDEKTAIEAVIFSSDGKNDKEKLFRFLTIFKNYFSLHRAIHLLFIAEKQNEQQINLLELMQIFELPEGVKKIDLKLIKKITHTEATSTNKLILEDKSPLSTLSSRLVVRTDTDIKNVTELAERFIMLKFVDDEIAKVAIAYHDRMNSVSLIQYDVDFLGNPYFSRRELKLINEVIDIAKNS